MKNVKPLLRALFSTQRLHRISTKQCGACHMSSNSSNDRVMQCWQLEQYGGYAALQFSESMPMPIVRSPDDVLVKVHAASVNPVDLKVMGGYGATSLNLLRKTQGIFQEFPQIPGRDFSGTVVQAGKGGSARRFKAGDEVWGAVLPVRPHGTMAEYVLVPSVGLAKKPGSLSHVEACSMPYVGITVWAALCFNADLSASNTRNKRVLVLGGSGGTGTFAIQLLKAWGAEVTTTCSEDAAPLMAKFGADIVLNYKDPEVVKTLNDLQGFDVIFDTTGDRPEDFMKLLTNKNKSTYVTIVSQAVSNNDNFGVLPGLLKTALTMAPKVIQSLTTGKNHRWAVVQNSQKALRTMTDLVNSQQIVPVIDRTFTFEEVPAAFEKLSTGPNRGKTVVQIVK